MFVLPGQIDTRWVQIKETTRQGCLGIQAKAATARQNPLATSQAKLICLYDWLDRGDVRRVLRGPWARASWSCRSTRSRSRVAA